MARPRVDGIIKKPNQESWGEKEIIAGSMQHAKVNNPSGITSLNYILNIPENFCSALNRNYLQVGYN